MINNILKLSAVMAISIYIFFIVLLLYYFNHHTEKQNRHFVKKNDEKIAVSLAATSANKVKHRHVKATSSVKKRVKKRHKRRKKKRVIKKRKPKKTHSKHKAKKRSVKKNREKKRVSNLFNKVKSKHPSKNTSKSKGSSHSMKKKSAKKLDKGIENAYFAKIENILASWPAQSEFAGEKITVWIKVKNDGSFTFKLLSHSNNRDFNSGLIQYLKQLQKIGFDAHKNAKPYELNIEFIAKE